MHTTLETVTFSMPGAPISDRIDFLVSSFFLLTLDEGRAARRS